MQQDRPNILFIQADYPEYRAVRDVLCDLIAHRWNSESLAQDIIDYRFPEE